jgi:hypothetical protein
MTARSLTSVRDHRRVAVSLYAPELILGLVTLIGAVILLCPMCLAVLARIGRLAPIAVRLAPCATCRATGPARARRSPRSASVCWPRHHLGRLRRPVRQRPRLRRALLFILVGMPLIAVAVGWLLAGREPPAIAHQPIE